MDHARITDEDLVVYKRDGFLLKHSMCASTLPHPACCPF
eukprot:SAG11_NODE_23142_length_394_cov_1.054237_1_plen_38_part_10